MRRVLFLGRGSTVIAARGRATIASLKLQPGVIPALLRFRAAGYELALAEPLPKAAAQFLTTLFASQGVRFTSLDAVTAASLDMRDSAIVCGRGTDRMLASRLGGLDLRSFAVRGRNAATWEAVAHALLDRPRTASVQRRTRETDIRVSVDLDSESEPRARTGLGFFDHMLEQLGKHGGFRLEVVCTGDLHIDEHHTIEDVALTLGQALREALGDKRGIRRYGFLLPMDEADAEVSVDLGGRPYLVFEGTFPREQVGGLPTELVPHFFRSLAETLGAAIHVRVRGENTHHMIEVCFKAVARALRQAFRREGHTLPTTKGRL
jgi:imidazoleglycerol-phosphate dehydratase/histidinol-phosphatase